jgi:hypothetical protein
MHQQVPDAMNSALTLGINATAQLKNSTFKVSLAGGTAGGEGELASDRRGDALGGAVYSSGSLDIQSCVFSSNGATGGGGGAVMGGLFYTSGGEAKGRAVYSMAALSVDLSTFNGNYAVAGNKMIAVGGAITSYGSVSMQKSTIAGNTAKSDRNPTTIQPTSAAARMPAACMWAGPVEVSSPPPSWITTSSAARGAAAITFVALTTSAPRVK